MTTEKRIIRPTAAPTEKVRSTPPSKIVLHKAHTRK
jgi:hypothetical protein